MTSYRVVAPVFLVRFQGPEGVLFRGWSPRRYGPVYTYDLVIEAEDDQHPAMNVEYTNMVRRVLDQVQQEQGLRQRQRMVDVSTDFHCAVPVEQRGDEGFVVTFQDGVFSPVFFLREDAVLYQAYLQEELDVEFAIRSFVHERI